MCEIYPHSVSAAAKLNWEQASPSKSCASSTMRSFRWFETQLQMLLELLLMLEKSFSRHSFCSTEIGPIVPNGQPDLFYCFSKIFSSTESRVKLSHFYPATAVEVPGLHNPFQQPHWDILNALCEALGFSIKFLLSPRILCLAIAEWFDSFFNNSMAPASGALAMLTDSHVNILLTDLTLFALWCIVVYCCCSFLLCKAPWPTLLVINKVD